MLCARIGVVSSANQIEIQNKVKGINGLEEKLGKIENKLKGIEYLGSNGKISSCDAKVFSSLYNLFALVFLPNEREKYPNLNAYFIRCTKHLGDAIGGSHMLGLIREGNQVDCRATHDYVRSRAVRANNINAGVKKKVTQRQLEKSAKKADEAKMKIPEAATEFQFKNKISPEASNGDKVKAIYEAIKLVGGNSGKDVIYHEAAHTMKDMPFELRSKEGYICKNLFLKAKKPRKNVKDDSLIWLISVPQECKVDLKKISKALGYKDELRQAKPELLLETLGLKPGSVTPLALINDSELKVNVILDEEMMSKESNICFFHPLTNEVTIGISALDLSKIISASARVPTLMSFDREIEEKAESTATETPPDPPAVALELSHENAQKRIWDRLAQSNVIPFKENDPDLSVKRPLGHSTHNLFVKDKKTKQLYMITMAQDTECDLKKLAKIIGCKELRFSSDRVKAFCNEKGCLTLLSLYNNVQGSVIPVIEKKLFSNNDNVLRICAGCDDPNDHSQHNAVDVSVTVIKEMLQESFTPEPIMFDLE